MTEKIVELLFVTYVLQLIAGICLIWLAKTSVSKSGLSGTKPMLSAVIHEDLPVFKTGSSLLMATVLTLLGLMLFLPDALSLLLNFLDNFINIPPALKSITILTAMAAGILAIVSFLAIIYLLFFGKDKKTWWTPVIFVVLFGFIAFVKSMPFVPWVDHVMHTSFLDH